MSRPDTYAELRLAEGKLLAWDERNGGAPCALQPRDAEILTALARYRFLTTAQIAELWWADKGMRAVRRRMTQLFEAALVERFRPQTQRGAYQWVYCLTRDGFRAAEQSGELPAGLRFTPRRERIFDYRYVIHDLLVNEWVLRYRAHAGSRLLDWGGPDESRTEPPRKSELDDLAPDGYVHDWGVELNAIGPVHPDARLEVEGDQGAAMVFVEYDRTRRVDKNFDKFRRYEAFLAGWWKRSAVAEWAPPAAVFICQDDEHALRFINAADVQLTAYRSRWVEGEYVAEYVARDRLFFVIDGFGPADGPAAYRLPHDPPNHADRERRVRPSGLPGLPAQA